MNCLEELRAKCGVKVKKVHIEELGMDVYVKPIAGDVRGELYKITQAKNENRGDMVTAQQSWLIARHIVNEDGSRVFSDEDALSIERDFSLAGLDLLQGAIFQASEVEKTVDDLAKNSEPTPIDSLPLTLESSSAGGTSTSS